MKDIEKRLERLEKIFEQEIKIFDMEEKRKNSEPKYNYFDFVLIHENPVDLIHREEYDPDVIYYKMNLKTLEDDPVKSFQNFKFRNDLMRHLSHFSGGWDGVTVIPSSGLIFETKNLEKYEALAIETDVIVTHREDDTSDIYFKED